MLERNVNRTDSSSRGRGQVVGIVSGLAAGALGMFMLDPQNGRRRRALARDKAVKFRHTLDQAVSEDIPKRINYVSGFLVGAKHEAAEAIEGADKRPANEQMLADRVMSSVFRDPNVPKGDVNVNAIGTTVYLRGSVDNDATARDIEQRVRGVDGVDDVVNLINEPEVDPSELRQPE